MKAKTAFPSPKGGCCDLGTESDSVLWTPPRWYGLKRWINGLLFGVQRKIHDITAGGARPHPCEGTPVQEAETVPRGVVPKRVRRLEGLWILRFIGDGGSGEFLGRKGSA